MTETRTHIKERMLKAAAAAWGYTDKVSESAFDPLVALLIEVYAAELEKISNEICMSRERVLEKMIRLMAPDVLTAPVPAHGILYAQSIAEQLLVDVREQFYVTHQQMAAAHQQPPAGSAEIWFSPAGNYTVTDISIKYMAAGQKIFRCNTPANREIWSPAAVPLQPNTLWLGIAGEPAAFKGAQVYFELHNEGSRAAFYHHLPEARWWRGSRQLKIRPGYNSPGPEDDELTSWLQAPHNIGRSATRLVRALYQRSFIHIIDDPVNDPGVFEDTGGTDEGLLNAALPSGERINWLRVQFPENIHAYILEDLHCQVNCFPVINRQLHELTYRRRDWINIIPLRCEKEHQFLDLQSVTDQDGNPRPDTLLRKGGAGRFDERDAKAVTEHLLQLLRDESAAFSLYNREFITGEIRQVQQVINRLSRQMDDVDTTADQVPYLEVNGDIPAVNQHLSVEYWSTQGARANLIKAGTPAMAYKNGGLRQGSIFLMTTTMDGRNRLRPHESIPAYKSAVLSKDRIMSAEDIRLFCVREADNIARSVEVKKGVMIAQGRQAGYVKTIDVFITLDGQAYESMRESGTLDQWRQRIQSQLTERSMAFMPFRVFTLNSVHSPLHAPSSTLHA